MGATVFAYAGPIVRIKLQEVMYAEDVNCCVNSSCKRFQTEDDGNFCKECGGRITLTSIATPDTLGWRDFLAAHDYIYEDVLLQPEYLGGEDEEVLILNSTKAPGVVHMDSDDGNGIYPMSRFSPSESLTSFTAEHAQMIKRMNTFFTSKLATIEYAICLYWQ